MGAQGSNQHTTQAKLGEDVAVDPGTVVQRPDGLRLELGGGVYVLDTVGDHVVNPDAEARHTIRVS